MKRRDDIDWFAVSIAVAAVMVVVWIVVGAIAHATPPIIEWSKTGTTLQRGKAPEVRLKSADLQLPLVVRRLPDVTPTPNERDLIATADAGCERTRDGALNPWTALALLRVEREEGLPKRLHGLTLAVWCGEAAFGLDGVGDGGRAIGAFQMHPGALWLWCGKPDRKDPIAAAQCWLRRVRVLAEGKALKRCGKRRAWEAAELWVSQGGQKSGYSCRAITGHVARLDRWSRLRVAVK